MPGFRVPGSFCEVSVLTIIYQDDFDALLGCQALGESGECLRASASHSGGEEQFCRSKTVSVWTSKKISFNCLGPKLLETKPHLGPMMLYHKEMVYHKESVTPPAQEDCKGVFFMACFFLCRQEGQCLGIPMLPLGLCLENLHLPGKFRCSFGVPGFR